MLKKKLKFVSFCVSLKHKWDKKDKSDTGTDIEVAEILSERWRSEITYNNQ